MAMQETLLMQEMTDTQRLMFQSEMNRRRKSSTTGILLALLLGNVGAHRFYLGDVWLGLIYLLFCLTFVPGIVALVELFLMKGRVEAYNARQATEVAMQIRSLVPSGQR